MEAHNANYVGGDVATGSNDPLQLVLRPRVAIDPYGTGIPGVYIRSAATPPGAGGPRHVRVQRGPIDASPDRPRAAGPDRGVATPFLARLLIGEV